MMSDANGNQSLGEMNHIRERMIALQRSASNLAQLDLDALANLLPPGTSREQLAEIKSKLIQLHELQNRRHGIHAENDNSLASIDGVTSRSSRYKTELCRPFEENGVCKYGTRCQFAHGVSELRNLARHPKYKSQLCRTFHSNGLCPYGHRCHFIHNQDEARTVARPIASSFPGTRNFADLNMNHFRRNDAYSDFQCGELSRRASISDLSSDTFQKQITNSLMQSFFPRFTPDTRAANEMPIPFAIPPLNNFKPLSNGCSLGSAGELSPPVSPIVYSSDDAFPPQIAGRQGFFSPGVFNDSTELNLNQMLGLSRFPVPVAAASPHANVVSENRAPHATEDSHVSSSQNIPASWWSGASGL